LSTAVRERDRVASAHTWLAELLASIRQMLPGGRR
jgi:hypothetical protein